MKSKIYAILLVSLFTVAINTQAQQPVTAAESAEKLRAQLLEVQTREAELNARAQQLDEQLKPENIERSLAGLDQPGRKSCERRGGSNCKSSAMVWRRNSSCSRPAVCVWKPRYATLRSAPIKTVRREHRQRRWWSRREFSAGVCCFQDRRRSR